MAARAFKKAGKPPALAFVARAVVKNAQLSPQKGRAVANMVRGLSAGDAALRLRHIPQKGGKLIGKALNSAIANAEENHNADIDALRIFRIQVLDGMGFARIRFGARGRANRIVRRRSHIVVELGRPAAAGGGE
jgi:large subunit ribosomal protein L22